MSTYSNGTQTALEEDDEDDLTESDVTEFKERVRRLIPYMIYSTVNNGVSREFEVPPKSSEHAPQKSHYYLIHKDTPETKSFTKHDTIAHKTNKFVPSVQYNPKDDGIDSDHFIPIRYGTRLPSSQQSYHKPDSYEYYDDELLYGKYNSPVRPSLQESEKETDYPGVKTVIKLVPAHLPEYSSDYYDSRPLMKVSKVATVTPEYDPFLDVNFESNRYISPDYPRQPKPVLIPKATAHNSIKLPIKLSSLGHIVKSLRLTNRLPENLNRGNIDSSISTLIEILDILNGNHNSKNKSNAVSKNNEFRGQYEKPHVITQTHYEAIQSPSLGGNRQSLPQLNKYEIKDIPKYVTISANKNQYPNKLVQYYVPITQNVNIASGHTSVPNTEKHIPQRPAVPSNIKETNEYSYDINNTDDDTLEDDRFTLPPPQSEPVTPSLKQQKHSDVISGLTHAGVLPPPSFKYGATRGKPHIDYPAYSTIPKTNFNCKKQRYKGFFGDPSTGCQVWHYCDLNGGKSSFLCPNGTIFSQIALTCDWWFNVKCESTTQLYVLNERLYKYILPIMPKFPEDFTGPEVDRYLEYKFKEMEEKLKEKKKKKQQEKEKMKLKSQSIENKDSDS